ncbi:hypothetical protein SUNI508_11625 [Seiridium unicorne]|uniref:Ubiquitin-like protease family profile domain-containing protein n=1 Tax=Seiridium unicorne TaxID=138068 RepID=A0ABR2UGR5_9PEZI
MAHLYFGYDVHAQSRAGKVVSTGELLHDRTRMHGATEAETLDDVGCAISGMNYLQIARNRGVVAQSFRYAISHLRNQLDYPSQVHTPAPNSVNWFHHDGLDTFMEETNHLDPQINTDENGAKSVWFHPVFQQFRSRKSCVWVVRAAPPDFESITDDRNAHWVVIVANFVDQVPVLVSRGMAFAWNNERDNTRDVYYDRTLHDVQIFDPLLGSQAQRAVIHSRIAKYFGVTMNRAGIAYKASQMTEHQLGYNQVANRWETGYQVYAIVQEYFRRLQLGQSFSRLGRELPPVFWEQIMWYDYNGLHATDVVRESMMTACAARAVAISGFRARLAVELPGRGAGFDENNLNPETGPGVTVPRPQDAEEAIGDHYVSAGDAHTGAVRSGWT